MFARSSRGCQSHAVSSGRASGVLLTIKPCVQADTVLATTIQGNASICSLACRSNPSCNVFNYCAVASNCTAMGLTFNQCQIGFSNVVAAYAPTPNVTANGAGMISGEHDAAMLQCTGAA